MTLFAADFDEKSKRSRLKDAFILLQEANEIDPTNTEVLLQMAELLVELSPDDTREQERILQRIQKLLGDPKNDREKFQLAKASFLHAITQDVPDKELLKQAGRIFESLGQTEWLRQCEELLADIPGQTSRVEAERLSDPNVRMRSGGFNPAGRWHIQIMDAVGSIMDIEFYPNGTFQSVQQDASMGLNVQAAGQWVLTRLITRWKSKA